MALADKEFPLLAARLKAAGAVGIRREMVSGLRAAAKPLPPLLQQAARDKLPKAGGLNEYVAKNKPKVQVRTAGRNAGVRVTSKVKGNYTDTGTWRHPVFGHRDRTWAVTRDPSAARWWEDVEKQYTPQAAAAMAAVLATIRSQVIGRGL